MHNQISCHIRAQHTRQSHSGSGCHSATAVKHLSFFTLFKKASNTERILNWLAADEECSQGGEGEVNLLTRGGGFATHSTAQGETRAFFYTKYLKCVKTSFAPKKNCVKTFFAPSLFVPKMWGAKKHGLLSLAFTLLMSFPDSSNCSGFHWLSASRR